MLKKKIHWVFPCYITTLETSHLHFLQIREKKNKERLTELFKKSFYFFLSEKRLKTSAKTLWYIKLVHAIAVYGSGAIFSLWEIEIPPAA